MTDAENTVAMEVLFAGKDASVLATYRRIIEALRPLGPFHEEPKKTSIHLARSSGFAGVHPKKGSLYLTIRTEHPIASPRIAKTEQVSKNRYHNDLKLTTPDDVDAELISWLKDAYALG